MAKEGPNPERPWHRGLSRDDVAEAALALLDAEGRQGLTMRRLAARLEVKAASLYNHVHSKEDLVDAVLDRVLGDVEVPAADVDVRGALVAGFVSYRRALTAHPAVVVLMTERSVTSAAQVLLVERSMELFAIAGLTRRQAVDAHVTLTAYVLGFILQEVSRPATAPAGEPGPVMRDVLSTLGERSVDERFEVGLHLILDSVVRTDSP